MTTQPRLPSQAHVVSDLLYAEVGADVVILQLERGIYYSLNGTGARVWMLLGRSMAPAEIRDALVREYEVDAGICTADLCAFLDQLSRGHLIDLLQ